MLDPEDARGERIGGIVSKDGHWPLAITGRDVRPIDEKAQSRGDRSAGMEQRRCTRVRTCRRRQSQEQGRWMLTMRPLNGDGCSGTKEQIAGERDHVDASRQGCRRA